MRGVHPQAERLGRKLEGSSPHARGPLDGLPGQCLGQRIIPACAGSTVKRFIIRTR